METKHASHPTHCLLLFNQIMNEASVAALDILYINLCRSDSPIFFKMECMDCRGSPHFPTSTTKNGLCESLFAVANKLFAYFCFSTCWFVKVSFKGTVSHTKRACFESLENGSTSGNRETVCRDTLSFYPKTFILCK